jgi:hypothetical protein
MDRFATDSKEGAILNCRVVPASSRNSFSDIAGGAVKVKITAAPVDGMANRSLIAFLSKSLKMPKGDIKIIRGETAKRKVLLLEGRTAAEVAEKIMKMIKESG